MCLENLYDLADCQERVATYPVSLAGSTKTKRADALDALTRRRIVYATNAMIVT
jgi:hypothetical protein